jgi:hypothetical protein
VIISQAALALNHYIEARVPAVLHGDPGIGKTAIVHNTTDTRAIGCIVVNAQICDPVDVGGLPVPDLERRRTVWLEPDELPNVDRDGPEGVVFFDEIDKAPQSVQNAFLALWHGRKIRGYVLPDGWQIVAAVNRLSNKAGSNRLTSALTNRAAHIDCEADLQGFLALSHIHPLIRAFIMHRPNLLHKMTDEDGKPLADLTRFPSPRAWENCGKIMSVPDMERRALRLASGIVGDAPAGELEAFVDMYRKLPAISTYTLDPMGAPVPAEPSLRFALTEALARYSNPQNFASICQFFGRMPREFEVRGITVATERNPDLKNTAAYVDWSVRNAGVQL